MNAEEIKVEENKTEEQKTEEIQTSVETRKTKKKKERKRVPITHRVGAKVIAFMLAVIMAIVVAWSVLIVIFMIDQEIYTTNESVYRDKVLSNLAEQDAKILLEYTLYEGRERALEYVDITNIAKVTVKTRTSYLLADITGTRKITSQKDAYSSKWYRYKIAPDTYQIESYSVEELKDSLQNWYLVDIWLADDMELEDKYYVADNLISIAYLLRYWIYAIAIVALVLCINCIVFLLCASGRHVGKEEPEASWGTRIPFDLVTGITITIVGLFIAIIAESTYFYSFWKIFLVDTACGIGLFIVLLSWSMTFALRIKLGKIWKNTISAIFDV